MFRVFRSSAPNFLIYKNCRLSTNKTVIQTYQLSFARNMRGTCSALQKIKVVFLVILGHFQHNTLCTDTVHPFAAGKFAAAGFDKTAGFQIAKRCRTRETGLLDDPVKYATVYICRVILNHAVCITGRRYILGLKTVHVAGDPVTNPVVCTLTH